jgi:hypothetical protein
LRSASCVFVNILLIGLTITVGHAQCSERPVPFGTLTAVADKRARGLLLKAVQARIKGAPRVIQATHWTHYREVEAAGRLPLTHYLYGEVNLKRTRGSYLDN